MAGRFVVIEFDDRDAAQTFVDREEELKRQGATPLAMFIRPERFCQCPSRKRQNAQNWARGSRSGIWLCKVCKKPSEFHNKGVLERLVYVFGHNLLGVESEE